MKIAISQECVCESLSFRQKSSQTFSRKSKCEKNKIRIK